MRSSSERDPVGGSGSPQFRIRSVVWLRPAPCLPSVTARQRCAFVFSGRSCRLLSRQRPTWRPRRRQHPFRARPSKQALAVGSAQQLTANKQPQPFGAIGGRRPNGARHGIPLCAWLCQVASDKVKAIKSLPPTYTESRPCGSFREVLHGIATCSACNTPSSWNVDAESMKLPDRRAPSPFACTGIHFIHPSWYAECATSPR